MFLALYTASRDCTQQTIRYGDIAYGGTQLRSYIKDAHDQPINRLDDDSDKSTEGCTDRH